MVRAAYIVAVLPRGEAPGGVGGRMEETRLSEELKKMEREPLLDVEKQLIGWSLGIGVVLLALLVWISHMFI